MYDMVYMQHGCCHQFVSRNLPHTFDLFLENRVFSLTRSTAGIYARAGWCADWKPLASERIHVSGVVCRVSLCRRPPGLSRDCQRGPLVSKTIVGTYRFVSGVEPDTSFAERGRCVPCMTIPRPAQRWRITKPSPLVLLALPYTLAFFQPPPAALSTARRGSLAATWPAESGGGSAVTRAAVGRRRRTVLFGKNRKKRKGTVVSQDSPSWFDDDEEDALMEGGEGGDGDGATASAAVDGAVAAAAGPFSTTAAAAAAAAATERGPSSAPPPTATASFNDESPAITGKEGSPSASAAPVTDDALLPDLDDLDDDGNEIVLEPVWVEGETQGEKPIVETYGLNDALATAQDGIDIDIDNGMMIDPEDEALLIPADGVLSGGLADGVGPESWRNGMEVPDDDVVLGERFNMVGRGLDDMLMERSIRFYDPKVRTAPIQSPPTLFLVLLS